MRLDNPLLQAALEYAGRGWRVLPLHSVSEGRCSCGRDCGNGRGKHPLTRRGVKDATADRATIEGWWATWPQANVGIATGPESGLFMLGPDGQAGVDALAELEGLHGPLPPTPLVRSGGGGRHYYFSWPADGGVRNGANHGGLPIDVRGEGGYAVAPPSLHHSGQRYGWEVPPWEIKVAPAPAWLLGWLRRADGHGRRKGGGERRNETILAPGPGDGVHSFPSFGPPPGSPPGPPLFTVGPGRGRDVRSRAVAYLEKCPPAVSGQGGHGRAFEVARAVVYGFDLGPEAGLELLREHYNPRCVPPWSEAELRHKCEDADSKPFDKPRGHLLRGGDGGTNAPAEGASSGEEIEALPIPPPPPWPVLPHEALHGLAGDIVRALAPETESDPVAVLGQLLAAFGNAVGRGPHFRVEGDAHHANLFLCLVGESARGRKGTSRGRVMQVMAHADPRWCENCLASGLSSGEGLIWAVRDPVERSEPVREKGRVTGYQNVTTDEGVSDKRLFADESEFAQVLKVLQREGNSLSPVVRQCWDNGLLRTLIKNSPARATGAHVSISAHVTRHELARHLKDTEALNGFANRFLWLCARRSRLLPDGGRDLDLAPLGHRLGLALAAARNVGAMTRGEAAARLWREEYPRLTADRGGLYGAVTGRAEAQVLRLSMVYALLDGSCEIGEAHLRAALALWSYADESARITFGAAPECPLAGRVLARLSEAGASGLTRTDLHNAFCRNVPAAKLVAALAQLRDRGDAFAERVRNGGPGAPAERWFARRTDESTGPAAGGANSFDSSARPPSEAAPSAGGEATR